MADVPLIIQKRHTRQEKSRRRSLGMLAISCALLLSLASIVFLVGATLLYTSLIDNLPSPDLLPALLDAENGILREPTRFYDRTGQHLLATIQNPAAQDSKYLPISSTAANQPASTLIPSSLISATLATVDPGFWIHPGFNLGSVLRDSNPTIAQRLAKDLLLWDEPPSLRRTLREKLLAAQLTSRFGRAQLLEWYLNSANYGQNTYGVDAASSVYFGKPASQLTLQESAWLAALAEAPELPPGRNHYEAVIQAMFTNGLISASQATDALQNVTEPVPPQEISSDLVPAYTELVMDRLAQFLPADRIKRGGLKIFTTLDFDLQAQTTCAMQEQLNRLGTGSTSPALVEGLDCQAARLLPTISAKERPTPGSLAANALILDPSTGQILAYVGDPNHHLSPGYEPGHPPGSLLSPFIYLTAFTRGMSPATLAWDISSEDVSPVLDAADPEDHGPVRLRIALANDYLVPAAQLLNRIGPENVWRIARQLGLEISLPSNSDSPEDILLNNGETTLLEISQAYGAVANQGTLAGHFEERQSDNEGQNGSPKIETVPLLRVEDVGGRTWLDWSQPQYRPIVSPQLAYLLTQVLSDETARWPSIGHPNALEIGRPAAAKSGQTISGKDAWTIGFTPQLLAGVWIGNINTGDPSRVSPVIPASLWHAMIQYSHRDLPSQNWTVPAGISTIQVCDPSGMLPSPVCPNVVSEIFLAGTEPTQADNLYRATPINRETGLLATVFTPNELVEEHVFLAVPPEAAAWARQAGIATPPDAYDVITSNVGSSADAEISSPQMFSFVRGEVPIRGTASGPDFTSYRIEIGKGLNPETWLQIGEDVEQPVEDGELATWDTSGLSGLYAIELLVTFQDQKVDRSIVQVTVDNEPPEVKIHYPQNSQIVDAERITFQVQASDDLRLQNVTFYIDDRELSSSNQPPYAAVWISQPGDHALKVVATDQAGNSTQSEVTFLVK